MHRVNRIPWATVRIADGEAAQAKFAASNEDIFTPGQEVTLLLGHDGKTASVFKGVVVTHSIRVEETGLSELVLGCKDAAFVLAQERKSALFHQQTDDAVLSSILRKAGLKAEIDPCEVTHEELVQYHATDWDFLVTRAEANGLVVTIADGTVTATAPDTSLESRTTYTFGTDILACESAIDGRDQPTGVAAQSWDPTDQGLSETTAKTPDLQLPGNLTGDDLAQALKLKDRTLRHGGAVSGKELATLSDAYLTRYRLGKVQGSLLVEGALLDNEPLRPGNTLTLKGLSDRFNGTIFVSGVRHTVRDGQWLTTIHYGLDPAFFAEEMALSAPPASGMLPAVGGLQIGVVSQLEADPLGEDRILVRIPVIDEVQDAVWARWAVPDAGPNRGYCVRPEIGDEVVLGFLNDDPRFPVILGSLYSSQQAAPLPGEDANGKKTWVTRSEMAMSWDDEKVQFSLSTPSGNEITLDEEQGELSLKDMNGNSVTLDKGGISLHAAGDLKLSADGDIKLEGSNINMEAQSNLIAKASSGAELSAGGETTIKGAMVKIN